MSLALLLLAPVLAPLAPQLPAAVPTKVRSAALFKNGLAFVQRSGVAPADSAQVRIDSLPVPTHGTVWVTPGNAAPALGSADPCPTHLAAGDGPTQLVEGGPAEGGDK